MSIQNIFSVPIYHGNLGKNPIRDYLDTVDIASLVEPNTTWNCTVDTGFFNQGLVPMDLVTLTEKTVSPSAAEYIKPMISKEIRTPNTSLHFKLVNLWLNRYLQNHNQEAHEHIGRCNVSFNYIYKTKEPDCSFKFSDLMIRGADKQMKSLWGFSFVDQDHELTLKEDDIIFFPSWLMHSVYHREDFERITLSGNFSVEVVQDA